MNAKNLWEFAKCVAPFGMSGLGAFLGLIIISLFGENIFSFIGCGLVIAPCTLIGIAIFLGLLDESICRKAT